MVKLLVQATQNDPGALVGRVREQVHNFNVCDSRKDAARCARLFHRQGYWVEIYDHETQELLSGPLDPDVPFPTYTV
ncbi:hypothetical protein DBB29_24895 [Pandoraea cepalis]|uniref:Phage protein n=1 Tax=Pandoraea cepalis TaxID=2508294 RepID=A0AAW7MGK6_9BURK|nr:hypothetical protein [Pandoraea cepalis]MDN4571900.1 hypothetical protein [Pandoraea cepalis]MDN4581354.1 hypothetical protein [Pandoraea cepalis]